MNCKILKSAAMVLAGVVFSASSTYAADGYGAAATGGAGGTAVTVTTSSAFIAAATSSKPMIITVSGTISPGQVSVTSNKTIQGANSSATIHGDLFPDGQHNIIFQNLNFTNPTHIGEGDGITMKDHDTNIFITHCTFTDCADGSVDCTRQSDFVTISWCRFRYIHQTSHNFVNLIGHDDSFTSDRGFLHVTMHDNWYDVGCKERMPRVRFGRVHCYNNYYGCPGNDYCLGVGNECQILLENGYFDHVNAAWKNYSSSGHQGLIHFSGNDFVSTAVPTWAPNSTVFKPPYAYTLETASGVKATVMAGAGNH